MMDQVVEEKKRRRKGIANEIAKRKVVEQTVDELYDWIDELHSEINLQKNKQN